MKLDEKTQNYIQTALYFISFAIYLLATAIVGTYLIKQYLSVKDELALIGPGLLRWIQLYGLFTILIYAGGTIVLLVGVFKGIRKKLNKKNSGKLIIAFFLITIISGVVQLVLSDGVSDLVKSIVFPAILAALVVLYLVTKKLKNKVIIYLASVLYLVYIIMSLVEKAGGVGKNALQTGAFCCILAQIFVVALIVFNVFTTSEQ